MNNKKKLSESLIRQGIINEAKTIKRKKEIYENILALETELKTLEEQGMVGTFGFKREGDKSSETKTGFENPNSGLSSINALHNEMSLEETSDVDAEKDELKKTNESLKKQISDLSEEINKLKNSNNAK